MNNVAITAALEATNRAYELAGCPRHLEDPMLKSIQAASAALATKAPACPEDEWAIAFCAALDTAASFYISAGCLVDGFNAPRELVKF